MSKILLVEDDPSLQKVYTAEFSIRGFELYAAGDGEKALDLAKSVKPDFIVLDLMIPKINGLLVLQNLKQNSITKDIPVMVVTNFGQEGNISRALQIGAEEVVLKYQATPAEIVQKVKDLLDRKQSVQKEEVKK